VDENRGGLGFARLLPILGLVLTVAAMRAQPQGLTTHDLTSVQEIRALTADQARQARPVRFHGVVTALSGWKNSFFVQDATAGISVDPNNASLEVQPGQSIEIRGITGPGLFAPVVVAQSVTILGKDKLPPAKLLGLDKLAGGKQDSQWLTIKGIVRSAVVKPSWGRSVLFLEIDISGGNLVTVRVHDFSGAGLDRLPGATVSVRGVCGTVFNDKRQFVGLRMFATNLDDVKIERPAPADPFAISITPLDSLLRFGDPEGAIERVKVRGIVTYTQPGQGLYIQDGTQGVFVQSRQTTPVAQGSRLEVVGYPAVGRSSPKLDDAVFRVIGMDRAPVGVAETASAMIVEQDGFPVAPYDSILVELKGRLVEKISGPDQSTFLFQDGTSVFTARLSRSVKAQRSLAKGSLISITGVCAAITDDAHEVRSFEILLRSPADLVVLEGGPWWTASHAGIVVAVLIAVILGMSVWLAVVRREARLRVLTLTDPLTGLYNRRGFLLLAEQQWKLTLRNKVSLLLFCIDVDEFKEINDSMGHQEGDIALQAVAGLLGDCFRQSDIIGRMGGDEFAVVAVDAPPRSRAMIEERLVKTVDQFNNKTGRAYQLSLSVGILACDSTLGALTIEALLAKADELMYQQKRDRKERVT
jgi:diguanylate cyclase (GGDEF)-like protein